MALSKTKQKIVDKVKEFLATDLDFLQTAVFVVYDRQTDDEQEDKVTRHSNDIGFNKADAYPMSDAAVWILNDRELEDDHDFVVERMTKYANQLSECEPIQKILDDVASAEDMFAEYYTQLNTEDLEIVPPELESLKDFIKMKQKIRKKEAYERRKEKLRAEREEAKRIKEERTRKEREERERRWKDRVEREMKERKLKEVEYKARKEFIDSLGEYAELKGDFVHETEKAVLLKLGDGTEFWIPKKLIKTYSSDSRPETYEVQTWFLKKNNKISGLEEFIREKIEEAGKEF